MQAMAKQTQSLELWNASRFWSFLTQNLQTLLSEFPLLTSNSLVSRTTPHLLKQICCRRWCIPASRWSLDSASVLHFYTGSFLYTPENARIAFWDFKFLKFVSGSFLGICSHNNISDHLFQQCHTQHGFQHIPSLSDNFLSLACSLYFPISSLVCLKWLAVIEDGYLISGPSFCLCYYLGASPLLGCLLLLLGYNLDFVFVRFDVLC